jgi:23S rRNA pseudouridine2605 synthase
MASERLQKILAKAGHGSRRSAEKLIEAGRVRVNGKVAQLGQKAEVGVDEIRLDHELVHGALAKVYIATNKRRGVLSSTGGNDQRPKITDRIPNSDNLHIVGRLDADSEGLMLLTNDGELTNQLTHPRYSHEKEYRVLVSKSPKDEQLASWRRGIVLEDGHQSRPAKVSISRPNGKGAWLKVVMMEGRKRQIREVAQKLGLHVVKLIRVRISSLELGTLKSGAWRFLEDEEISALKAPRKIA